MHHTTRSEEKVSLKVYYESLCPYSIEFFKNTLNETVTKLASYLDLTTYPYGNARRIEINGKSEIKCHHGPQECYGNKLHACAIEVLKNNTLSEFYNSCMMAARWGGKGSTDIDATNCGNELDIDAKPIIECAKRKKGEDLLEHYGEETEKVSDIRISGVPWILINGKLYDEDDYEDFIPTICAAFAHPPPECHEI